MKKSEKSRTGLYFMVFMIFIYGIIFLINNELFYLSFNFFLQVIRQLFWIFVFVFVLMIFTNYFFTPQRILKYLGKKSGKKSWFFAVVFGILSMGPIYMWYPLLSELKDKGMRVGLISCFLYNRAIKIPLLPLMIFYFSIKYVLVLLVIMIFASVLEGVILEKIIERRKMK